MSKLLYITNTSLDGYIEDENGTFDWTTSDEVFTAITELIRPIATHLYGRRLYQTMAYWDAPSFEGGPPERREFARIWQKAEKLVFSRTLAETGPNARIVREFDPALIRALKAEATTDVFIGGAELAARAFEADLVDECHLFINPLVVGGGKPAFRPGLRRNFELLDTRRFDAGVLYVRYRV